MTVIYPDNWKGLSFSEKIKWRCKNPDPAVDYRVMADKSLSKERVIPNLLVPKSFATIRSVNELDGLELPSIYVFKATHLWDTATLVQDHHIQTQNRSSALRGFEANNETLGKIAEHVLKKPEEIPHGAQYQFVEPGLLFEEYLEPIDSEIQLFFIHGEFILAMVLIRQFDFKKGLAVRIYNANWRRLPVNGDKNIKYEDRNRSNILPPPTDLLKYIQTTCSHIDQVRVDFLVSKGWWYFSEFTFTHNAGRPSLLGSYDQILADRWV